MSEVGQNTLQESQIVNRTPLDAYINTLFETLGVPNEGDDIAMFQIEKILNIQRHTFKWTSVIAKWKTELRVRHGIIITCKYGTGCYHAANDDEKLAEAMRRKGRAENETNRIFTILDTIDKTKLNADNRILFDKIRLTMQKSKLELAQSVK